MSQFFICVDSEKIPKILLGMSSSKQGSSMKKGPLLFTHRMSLDPAHHPLREKAFIREFMLANSNLLLTNTFLRNTYSAKRHFLGYP